MGCRFDNPVCNTVVHYAPTSEKLRGHVGLGLSVRPSVFLSVTLFGIWEFQEPLCLNLEISYVACT